MIPSERSMPKPMCATSVARSSCDTVGRLIVLYRDNAGSNGLTIVHSLPHAVDPQRTNWTTMDLTTANLGNYEPVIDESRWELDQQLHIVYQPSQGEGYTPPATPLRRSAWSSGTRRPISRIVRRWLFFW